MVTQTLPPPARPAAVDRPNDAAYWLDSDHPGLPVTLDLRPLLGGKTLAEIDFNVLWAFIEANDFYAIEYNETGELVIMPLNLLPVGILETRLLTATKIWERANGGIAASSATIFRIPGLGGRAPDASWVSPDRVADLDDEHGWRTCLPT